MDKHGNVKAIEGCTRCGCGAKYWEKDVCVSCKEPFKGPAPRRVAKTKLCNICRVNRVPVGVHACNVCD